MSLITGGLDQDRTYIDFKGRELFVSSGISGGEYWFTCYRVPGKGGTHRVKSPALPIRDTKEQAQYDLDAYASKNGF